MFEFIWVSLDNFVNGVAHCIVRHHRTEKYITSKGKMRNRSDDRKPFEGNVRFTPPHKECNSINFTFNTLESAQEFVETLKVKD